MTRHARNCTAGAVYTYHEKKKDARASGYGTNAQRLGKDSIKDFDCCSLSLQPCRNPVIRWEIPLIPTSIWVTFLLIHFSKDGYLFDKEVILEYIIRKKNEFNRKLKEFDRLKKKESEEKTRKAAEEVDAKVSQFLKTENNIVSKPIGNSGKGMIYLWKIIKMRFLIWFKNYSCRIESKKMLLILDKPSTSISNMANGKDMDLPSFWIPSKTPSAETSKLNKPDSTIYCPISEKVLKVKDLIDVKFTPVRDGENKSVHTKENRYMCAVTHDILSNSVPCAVLKPT